MAIALKGTSPPSLSSPSSSHNSRLHLTYLDGLRGLAALYVMVYHLWCSQNTEGAHTGLRGLLTNWLLYGHFAVDVFIVLSGFCLMLPVARRGSLTGGAPDFFARRAWRILPTFWAALILSFGLDFLTRHLDPTAPFAHLDGKAFLVNLLLLSDTLRQFNVINGVFWSVALEWKIYFFFPLVVLAWRRWGIGPALALTALIGYGIVGLMWWLHPAGLFTVGQANGFWGVTCPWYVFLFGLGIASAALAYGPRPMETLGRRWIAGVCACFVCVVLLVVRHPSGDQGFAQNWIITDPLVGVLAAFGLLFLSLRGRSGVKTWLHAVLSWRPLVSIGSFSYSLYLIHLPLLFFLTFFAHLAEHHGVPLRVARVCLAGFGLPLIVMAAYGFSRVFERPFLDARLRARVFSRLTSRAETSEPLSQPGCTDAAHVG